MIFSFSSTGEGVRAGAGPGVCIGTEIFNVSASPCKSKAVPKRKGGWVGVRGDIPGSRSRDIGYEFVDFRRPDLSSRAMD
jgi:hypothetical protein